MRVKIETLDDFGRGISHIDGKVVFIPKTLPKDLVEINIILNKKNYCEAEVVKIVKESPKRLESICPYFNKCGGCDLLNLKYNDTLDYKKEKIMNLFLKNKINISNMEIVENKNDYYYRNKLSLKIVDGKLGFYEAKTHKLVEINKCFVANEEINKVIYNYKLLNLNNAQVTIRCNLNKEILLVINTKDKENINIESLKKIIKLVGIVFNNKTIYGDSFYYERIHNMLFKVSYNSFFQVNPYITNILFDLVSSNINCDDIVLDLYSGVGTLSIVAGKKASKVYSIEIVGNAVLNGIFNAKLNKQNNIKFMLGDVAKTVNKINDKINTLIVDPPRSGLDKVTREYILKCLPEKIIYVSCDPLTLMRDLKELEKNYNIVEYKILDMFSYTYHLESFCVLKLKND